MSQRYHKRSELLELAQCELLDELLSIVNEAEGHWRETNEKLKPVWEGEVMPGDVNFRNEFDDIMSCLADIRYFAHKLRRKIEEAEEENAHID